jgi:hypothetical protein
MFRLLASSLLLLAMCLGSAQETACPPGCSPGRWSTDAIDLSSHRVKAPDEDRDIRVCSPDHGKCFHVINGHWSLETAGKHLSLPRRASELLYPAEIAWAPDGRAFFITSSAGYSSGYRTQVYRVEQDQLTPITQINGIVQKDFERNHRCFDGDTGLGLRPNLAGFKWLGSSDRLLVVAEVPPTGICREQEYFGGYEIVFPSRRIVRRLSPEQLSDSWGEVLGERLKSNLQFLSAAAKAKVP